MIGQGFFTGDEDYNSPQRLQMMANLLAPSGQQQSGLGQIGGALALKALQNRQAENAYNATPAPTTQVPYQGINGETQNTTLNTKMPYLGPKGLSGLFNFGGG